VVRRETAAGPGEEETADRGPDLAADLPITEGAGAPPTGPCPGTGRTPGRRRETGETRKKLAGAEADPKDVSEPDD